MYPNAITITFGDQAENHVGMQQIGQIAEDGFSIEELKEAANKFTKLKCKCEFINLNELLPDKNSSEAAILIIRNGVSAILEKNAKLMYNEQAMLNADKKAFMYGKVVNKHARHNLCFDEKDQEPDYENSKGRIIGWDNVPLTKHIRESLPDFFGEKAEDLTGEGNYYYDIKKCGIGFHGDAERKRVIAVRLGAEIPLHYQWFKKHKPVGERGIYSLQNGDIYAMSEKATGFDWKKSSIYTLRHAAGSKKFTTIKKKRQTIP
jgi:hypothetical protein